MGKIKDIQKKNWKIILFGPVGVGKTGFALTLGQKAQILDLDDGLITGQAMDDKFTKDRLEVDFKEAFEKSAQAASAFAKAKSIVTQVANDSMAGKYPFEYFILDSYTALAESAVRHVLFMNGKLGGAPEIQHWGMAFLEIKNIMLLLRMMPLTVVMIAHEQMREVDNQPVVEIATPGKNLPSEIPRYFDEVWRMRIKNKAGGKKAYVLQTRGTATVKVRSRGDLEDDMDTSLGMPVILEKLNRFHKIAPLSPGEVTQPQAQVKKG